MNVLKVSISSQTSWLCYSAVFPSILLQHCLIYLWSTTHYTYKYGWSLGIRPQRCCKLIFHFHPSSLAANTNIATATARNTLQCTSKTLNLLNYKHFLFLSLHIVPTSLVPRLPRNVNMYRGKNLVSFLCKHDVIRTERQHFERFSTNYAFNLHCVWYLSPNS